ncbi:hypothetical protein [Streptomyces graminilatus]|uniref:hypothetical protein n=1 Tax=Streptomyces graminilatus TaxID=1464070 RepID=UPI0006E180B1|nr:hypothetical protein [Streptomyces graminilatus]
MPVLPVIAASDLARHMEARLDALLITRSAGWPTTDWRIRVTGPWITVLWTNTPTAEQTAEAIAPLSGFRWDPASRTSSRTGELVTAPVKGRDVTGAPGIDGITLTRTFDEYTLHDASRYWARHQGQRPEGLSAIFPAVTNRHGDVVADPGPPKVQVRQIADHLVHRGWILH